jgi:heptosyltransferase-2
MAAQSSPAPLNLVGRTDLPTLAGVLAKCHSLVTNDSGAMHFAAALGLPVIAMFGPTREKETHPVGGNHAVLTHDVWCRPCMLKECPLTHRCMTGISVRDVLAATRARV